MITNKTMNSTKHHFVSADALPHLQVYLLVILSCISLSAWSQDLQDQVELANSTVDGGGGESAAGEFVLTGSIAQHDASTSTASNGTFLLAGGFWANANDNGAVSDDLIFADGFESP